VLGNGRQGQRKGKHCFGFLFPLLGGLTGNWSPSKAVIVVTFTFKRRLTRQCGWSLSLRANRTDVIEFAGKETISYVDNFIVKNHRLPPVPGGYLFSQGSKLLNASEKMKNLEHRSRVDI
jgi:hypothetical protein